MCIHFDFTGQDVDEALTFYRHWEHSRLVRDRYRRNVLGQHPALEPGQIRWALTLGLLTTQQRADADAPVYRVLNSEPASRRTRRHLPLAVARMTVFGLGPTARQVPRG
jgi:hypothetical protein